MGSNSVDNDKACSLERASGKQRPTTTCKQVKVTIVTHTSQTINALGITEAKLLARLKFAEQNRNLWGETQAPLDLRNVLSRLLFRRIRTTEAGSALAA